MRAKPFGTLNTLLIENLRRCAQNPIGLLSVLTAREAVFTASFEGAEIKQIRADCRRDGDDTLHASEHSIKPKKGKEEEFGRVCRALLILNANQGIDIPQFTIFNEEPRRLPEMREERPGDIGIQLLYQLSVREALDAFYFEFHELLIRHPAFLSFRWDFRFEKKTRSVPEKAANPSTSYEELVCGRDRFGWQCDVKPYIDPKVSNSGEAGKREHRICQDFVIRLLNTYSMLYPVFAQAGPQSISCAEIRQHMAMPSVGLLGRLHSLDQVFDVVV